MKLFSRIVTVLILPLLLIGSINYLIDPDYTLRKSYIPKIAKSLAEGKLLSGPINANGRLLKKEWIELLPDAPDVLVLGSSRTMGVTQNSFAGKTIFNASVTNCTFQDMYAFVNLMEDKQGDFPGEVIICCDQWLFGNSFTETRWLYNRENFIRLLQKTEDIPARKFPTKWKLQKEWLKELFSVRYFIRSIKQGKKKEQFEIEETILPEKATLLPDGSRVLPLRITETTPNETEEKAVQYFLSSHDEMFNQLDSFQIRLFENLVLYLRKKNCKLTLFIPPYHPTTWQILRESKQHSGIFKVDAYLLNLANEYQFNVVGSTNPSVLGLTEKDFYDGVHLQPSALSRLIPAGSKDKGKP